MNNEVRLVLILGLLSATLFLVGIGSRPLWNIDEGMHAATAKEMLLTQDWVTPTFNGEKFHDKPALFTWLTALSFMILGFTEFAARLPAATMGIGCVGLTYLLGRQSGGPMLGFLGGAILATSPMFITLSQAVVHDVVLVFFITLALFLFYLAYTRPQRQNWILFMYPALGLAVLTKGPVGIVLPGLTILIFLLLKRQLFFLKQMRIAWGLVLFLSVAAPWYAASSFRNPEYLSHFFVQQNLMNFLSSEGARHPEPLYYYLPLLLGGFFPWSTLLIAGLILPFRHGLADVDDGTLYLVIWFGVVLLFFSAASSKLGPYILPLFPAASLLVGRLWQQLFVTPAHNLRKAFVYCFGFLSLCMLGGLVYLFTNPPYKLQNSYGIDLLWVNVLSLFLSAMTIGAFVLILSRRYRAAFATNVASILTGILLFIFVIAPFISPYRSSKGLALSLNHLQPDNERLVFFRKLRDSALFYTNRKAVILHKPAEMMRYLEANPTTYAFISRYHFGVFPEIAAISEIVDADGADLVIRFKSPRLRNGGTERQ